MIEISLYGLLAWAVAGWAMGIGFAGGAILTVWVVCRIMDVVMK